MTTNTTEPDLVTEVEELLAKATPPCGCESKHCTGKTELNGLRFVCASEYGMSTSEYHIDDDEAALYEVAPELLRRLVEEVKRLRRGDFTDDEFQNLCHNADVQAGFDAFADGCEAYQQKMFGRCRTKGKVL